ncbi:MAG TPA: low molecular weight protein-tyrosine-phosphatase [Nannocystis sp.]|jgi:protein-tyrosine phosphatase
MTRPATRVLFVCHANMVRSPLAEGVFRHMTAARGWSDHFVIASAGVSAFEGMPPDPGSVAVAAAHGITLTSRSRQLTRADLYDHHHVLLADRHVQSQIRRLMGGSAFGELSGHAGSGARVRLLAALADPHAEGGRLDVADPVRGGPEGYQRMYQQVERACAALLRELAPGA